MPNQTQMQDKEFMNDVLSSQKHITGTYSTFANECAGKMIRDDLLSILREEHEIQADVFNEITTRGWYQTTPAEQQKIDQAKQKYAPGSQQ